MQIVIGSVPGGFGSYRDGFELFDRVRSDKKDIFVVEGASHYDLYDKPEFVNQALEKLPRVLQGKPLNASRIPRRGWTDTVVTVVVEQLG